MTHAWPFTSEKIAARLELIAPHVHRRTVALDPFRILPLNGARVDVPFDQDPSGWEEVPHHSYWGAAELNFLMQTALRVPSGWDIAATALHLPLGVAGDIFNHPEALSRLDGVPIGSADRYHHTIPLPAWVVAGGDHSLTLQGWTGLAGWPPDPNCKAKLFMGAPALVEQDLVLLDFLRLAETCLDTARTLKNETGRALLGVLDGAVRLLDTRAPLGAALHASAPVALSYLRHNIPQAGAPLDVTLHGIGHAHMDIAYLWPISQIRLKNARTYSNVLRLMEDDPGFHFSHSQPQLYAYTAADYPDLFAQIKTRVAEGRWEVMGGMWVEPDLNIPGPEALIRQLTLGRGYFKDTFGDVETPALWLPDTFGFPAQIPQLMRLAGLKWFVTNKLNWNQFNSVPSSTHHWEGLDGSRVLAHVLTTPRPVQYLPFPTNYKSDLTAGEVLGTHLRATTPDTMRDLPICYGYGDGGGGPTEALLAKARAFAAMPGMPQFRQSTVRAVFEAVETTPGLPVWSGEHYMEGHRGTYTSQGWIKRANRKAEWALHEAEAMAALAGQTPDLTEAWQLLCLNQFHDIITGTSVREVFEDAARDYARIADLVESVAGRAAAVLAMAEPSVVNTAPLGGARLALFPPGVAGGQDTEAGTLVHFPDLPPYAVVPLSRATAPEGTVTCRRSGDDFVLKNPFVTVTLTATGQVSRIVDSCQLLYVLAPNTLGNTLLGFEDRPICWDAWDIDPTYEERCDGVQGDTTAEILETGPLRASVLFTTRWRDSVIRQRVQLCAHSPRLDFVTEADWHERHTLLKAAFPTGLTCDVAEYDTQWGRVRRSTKRETAFDAARFEVPAQKWASLADGARGVAVLNDCKYGYDVTGAVIRITLIKCATSPDREADQGLHRFTYALLPYDRDTPEALDHEAYDLNAPLRVLPGDGAGAAVGLVRSTAANVIIETVKPAEDGRGVILRCFESLGRATPTALKFGAPVVAAETVTIFEEATGALASDGTMVTITMAPFEVVSLRVVLAASA